MKAMVALLLIGGAILLMGSVALSQDSEVRKVDISAIQARAKDVIIGGYASGSVTNVTVVEFMGKLYDSILINASGERIVYLGIRKGEPVYQATELLSKGITQKINDNKIEGADLLIVFGKNFAEVIAIAFIIGALGALIYLSCVIWN